MATPTKAELLETAKGLGLELTEDNTVKEIQDAIAANAKDAPEVDVDQPSQPDETVENEDPETTTTHDETQPSDPGDVTPVAPAQTPAVDAGAAIANAITEGMKAATESAKKPIRITSDANVQPRFSVVRNRATGEFLVRDNSDRTLSSIQLKSVEEKEAALQETDVEER